MLWVRAPSWLSGEWAGESIPELLGDLIEACDDTNDGQEDVNAHELVTEATPNQRTHQTMPHDYSKSRILSALTTHVNQRPGLEFGNYGDRRSYEAEKRRITRQRDDFNTMAAYVANSYDITAATLREGFRAYSGRLSLTETDGQFSLDYCAGQYYPTEFRAAACAVLGSAIFDGLRDAILKPYDGQIPAWEEENMGQPYNSVGDAIRNTIRRALGASLQKKWMD